MSTIDAVPSHLFPVGMLQTEPVQVTREPSLDLDDDNKPKTSPHFAGRVPYRVPVEIPRGYATKVMRDGKELRYPVFEDCTVKVWCEKAPAVDVGQYVVFNQVMVGVIRESGTMYVQALGVRAVD